MTNFNISIVVNTKGATGATKKVETGLKRLTSSSDRARGSLGRMFSLLLAFRSLKSAVSVLAEYSDSIQTIAAVTGASDVQLSKLNETAKQLGITTSFTATQAAEGLTMLARAGFDVDESLQAIGATLNLAKAGNIDLAQATEIATNTLRSFRLEAEQMTRVVDVMAKTANSTNTTVAQLGQAMKFAAPVAKGLGVSLESTSAALGVLANAGQKASLGGTGLRRVLASLESPTAKARKALKGLGLNAKDVQVSSVGLQGALDALARSGADIGDIFEIFGRRSGTAAAVLVENADSVKLLDLALKNAAGTAANMAEVMDRGLGKALLRVKSAVQGSIIALGDSGVTEFLVQQFDSLALRVRAVASNMQKVGKFLSDIGIRANDTEKQLSSMEKNSRLNELGAQISQATREVNKLKRAIAAQQERGFGATPAQLARIKQLEGAIAATTAEIKLNAKAAAELKRVRAAGQPTAKNLIARLSAQAAGLKDLTNETKIQAQAQKEISRLILKGQSVSPAQREAIVNGLKEIQNLKDKRAVLESILGPQKKTADTLKILNSLLKENAISMEQFNTAVEQLGATDPFKTQAESLALTNKQLAIRANHLGIEQEALLIELQLRQQGKDLTDKERDSLAQLLITKKKLTDEIDKQAKAEKDRAAAAAAQKAEDEAKAKRQASLIRELDTTGQLVAKEQELLALREKFPLLADEINAKLQDMQLQALETSTSLGDGFERAFIKINREAENFASVGESIVNVFADQATDALIKFAETGQLKFKEFASAILKDITRILARLLVVQAISATLGGVGGGAPAAGGQALTSLAGRASGGAVQKDRSFIVGENGPELFTPKSAGNISPAGSTGNLKQAAPVTNVQVVNVDDPEMVPQSIADGSSDEAIVNVISRNRDKLKGIL